MIKFIKKLLGYKVNDYYDSKLMYKFKCNYIFRYDMKNKVIVVNEGWAFPARQMFKYDKENKTILIDKSLLVHYIQKYNPEVKELKLINSKEFDNK